MSTTPVLLNTFAFPLQRLILCGGGGLPPAWGPLYNEESGIWTWNPLQGCAVRPDTATRPVLIHTTGWSLPLDQDSPWSARLAMIAAWMIRPNLSIRGAHIWSRIHVMLDVYGPDFQQMNIDPETGEVAGEFTDATPWLKRLPTFHAHLALHPPAVALLLALWDVRTDQ